MFMYVMLVQHVAISYGGEREREREEHVACTRRCSERASTRVQIPRNGRENVRVIFHLSSRHIFLSQVLIGCRGVLVESLGIFYLVANWLRNHPEGVPHLSQEKFLN